MHNTVHTHHGQELVVAHLSTFYFNRPTLPIIIIIIIVYSQRLRFMCT